MSLSEGRIPVTGNHLILPLPRPQYIRFPEGFITSLAWRKYQLVSSTADQGNFDLSLTRNGEMKGKVVFRPTENASTSKTPLLTTARMNREGYASFGSALKRHGLVSPDQDSVVGEAFIHGISGVASTKGMGQAASPMTPSLALLQNVAGVHASLRPPNLGRTLELMLAMGSTDPSTEAVADSWVRAAGQRLKSDPLLAVIDKAVSEVMLPGAREPREGVSLEADKLESWSGLFPRSPFSWFATMWQTITHEKWVESLPPRVWTDWATTVLRLAFGAAYLWEASWYESMARTVVGREELTWDRIVSDMAPPLQWHPASTTLTVRDLAPVLMWRVHRATYILRELDEWLDDDTRKLPVDAALRKMRDDDELRAKFVRCLGSKKKSSSGNNTWEAIKYALKVRESLGEHADHYGLLHQRNRYLTVEPKTEWIAVIASLSCPRPSGETDIARVISNLEELGMRPELADLVSMLEKAGLARGSADADQGVRVKSAF